MQLVIRGLLNKQIASELGASEVTVKMPVVVMFTLPLPLVDLAFQRRFWLGPTS